MLNLLTEAQFQKTVIDMAEAFKWRVYHTYDSRMSQAGFPDLVLVRPPFVIFAELKAEKGRVRKEQQAWLDDLSMVNQVGSYLWRPSDIDEIERVLR